jgi:L-aminopeptidase/D-esterase-like protein
MTGTNWVKESGFLEGPILLTGTHSVGTVRDAAIQWQLARGRELLFTYPLVAETFDFLNDANGEHVKSEHVWAALDSARTGPVVEGAVGGGTGMGCNGFKGGIGTSSRVVPVDSTTSFTLGVLVQCNYGGDLHILGAPVGHEITDLRICTTLDGQLSRPWTRGIRRCDAGGTERPREEGGDQDGQAADGPLGRGSIIVIVGTDAPFLPHQLERLARRVGMGLGRLGSWAGNGSGDLFLAFSTANRESAKAAGYAGGVPPIATIKMLENDRIDPFFRATIDATEEAVVNAMLAAETMTGADGIRVYGLPGDRVMAALRKYGRLP